MGKVQKSTTKKRDFINFLCSMTHNEINDFIKTNGKGPKPVRMYHLVDNKELSYNEYRNSKTT